MRGPLLVVAGFAVVAALLAWSRWLAGRRGAATGHLLLALAAATVVAAGWPFARILSSYETAAAGQAVAEVFFEQAGAQRYRATLTRLPSGRMQVFELDGDEWRLDARTLAWAPRVAGLGLRDRYRLERLSSRPVATTPAGPGPAAGFALVVDGRPGDGSAMGTMTRWSALVAASTREGPWEPMGHGSRFEVRFDGTGLRVEPRSRPDAQPEAPPR